MLIIRINREDCVEDIEKCNKEQKIEKEREKRTGEKKKHTKKNET